MKIIIKFYMSDDDHCQNEGLKLEKLLCPLSHPLCFSISFFLAYIHTHTHTHTHGRAHVGFYVFWGYRIHRRNAFVLYKLYTYPSHKIFCICFKKKSNLISILNNMVIKYKGQHNNMLLKQIIYHTFKHVFKMHLLTL